MKSVFWIVLLALLTLAIRGHNLRSTLIDGRIYFVDADCYSRMTRAQMVDDQFGSIIRFHEFENYPAGVHPHTTAPLDYLIVMLKGALAPVFHFSETLRESVLAAQILDVAGALISPLFGLLTALVLATWARWWMRRRNEEGAAEPPLKPWMAAAPALLFAISPILVHGTALGRPDHQGLLILLAAFALGAEWVLAGKYSRPWAVAAGCAWGLALWISAYEPFILLAAISFFRWVEVMFFSRSEAVPSAKILPWKWGMIAVTALIAILIERWHFQMPDETLRTYFANWAKGIGELRNLDLRTLFRWTGWFIVLSPILLVLAARKDRRAISVLGMLLVTLVLSWWQIRWGYFLVLVFAMSLPWQFAVLRRRVIAWPLFLIGLWPMAAEWESRLFPNLQAQKQEGVRRLKLTQMRKVAETIRGSGDQAFLAPWWQSPPLAYWSGQPGIAGSSHESLPGIVDTARFYTAADLALAAKILADRRVAWVIVDRAESQVQNSQAILGGDVSASALATTLADYPGSAPSFLVETPIPTDHPGRPQFYHLYRVQPDLLNP